MCVCVLQHSKWQKASRFDLPLSASFTLDIIDDCSVAANARRREQSISVHRVSLSPISHSIWCNRPYEGTRSVAQPMINHGFAICISTWVSWAIFGHLVSLPQIRSQYWSHASDCNISIGILIMNDQCGLFKPTFDNEPGEFWGGHSKERLPC